MSDYISREKLAKWLDRETREHEGILCIEQLAIYYCLNGHFDPDPEIITLGDGSEAKVGDKVVPHDSVRVSTLLGFHGGVCFLMDENGCYWVESALCLTDAHVPDSWEKLEEDADKDICVYWDMIETPCAECNHGFGVSGIQCGVGVKRDIVARAKKLAGVQ